MPIDRLTEHQRAIYLCWQAAPAATDRQIAADLGLRPASLSRILQRAFARLGVNRHTANALRGGPPALVRPMPMGSFTFAGF
jgi:hypothetical protein